MEPRRPCRERGPNKRRETLWSSRFTSLPRLLEMRRPADATKCSGCCLKGQPLQETVREFLATWRLGNAKRTGGSTCCLSIKSFRRRRVDAFVSFSWLYSCCSPAFSDKVMLRSSCPGHVTSQEVSPIDFQRDDVDVKFEKYLRLHSEVWQSITRDAKHRYRDMPTTCN